MNGVVWDFAFTALLLMTLAAILASMWNFHQSEKYKKFNLLDLITARDGSISRPAVMEFGAFVFASWVVVLCALKGNVSEGMFGLYLGAFIARAAHSAYINKDKKPGIAPPEAETKP